MTNIFVLHDHYSEKKLSDVVSNMRHMGAPDIRMVWMEAYNAWVALEGCHRLRACHELGLTPNIISVDWSDEKLSAIDGFDIETDDTIEEICDSAYSNTMLSF